MQITIDSTEPLDRVLDVVGALYGVSLQAAELPGSAAKSNGRSAAAAQPRKRRTGPPRKASTAARSSRRRARTAPDPAAVRSWAKENGHPVRDRGRVPAAVLAAYLAAGSSSK
jgi:nucleoid-associated protein Lsr2